MAEERARASQNTHTKTHTPKHLEGNFDQLLQDIKDWPHQPVNWSEKARIYQIKKREAVKLQKIVDRS